MNEDTTKLQSDLLVEQCQAVDSLYEKYAKSVGLTYAGLTVLEVIYDFPGNCTQKLICEQTHLPKQSVNTIIKYFLDNGFIELKEIPTDRRNKKLWLNKKGQEYADNIIGRLRKAEQKAMEHFTFEQINIMIEMLKTYENHFRESIDAIE